MKTSLVILCWVSLAATGTVRVEKLQDEGGDDQVGPKCDQEGNERSSDVKKFPTQGISIKLHLRWTKEFKDYWDGYSTDVSVALGKILYHAQTKFQDSSSKTFFLRLDPVSSEEFSFSDKRKLTLADLSYVTERKIPGEMYVYFGTTWKTTLSLDDYGKTYPGKICKYGKDSVAVVLHGHSYSGTGETLAFMIAEQIGIWTSKKNDFEGRDVKSYYGEGELRCLKNYYCHDEDWCSTINADQCENENNKFYCPKLCGFCEIPPYPANGLRINLHLHYLPEVENYFKNEYREDGKQISLDIEPALKQILIKAQSYFNNSVVTLNLIKMSMFEEPKFADDGDSVFALKHMKLLRPLIRPCDGSDADIFFTMFYFGSIFSEAFTTDICKDRMNSLAMLQHGRESFSPIFGFGWGLAQSVAELLGIPYWLIHHPANLTEEVKNSWERGTLRCLHEI